MASRGSKKSRRSWRRRLFLLFLLVGVGAWFLPWLATREFARPTLLAWAAPQLEGQVEVDSVSAGWFSAIELQGLRVVDTEGQPLLTAKTLRSEKSLAGLAGSSSDLGAFHLEEPTIQVAVRQGGSNLEDVIAALLEESPDDDASEDGTEPSPGDEPSPSPKATFSIRQGTIILQDPRGVKSEFRDVAMTVTHDTTAEQPLAFTTTGAITQASASNPLVALQLAGHVDPETLASKVALKTGSVGLQAIEPLLMWLDAEASARGEVAVDVTIHYDGASADARHSIVGKVDGRQLRVKSDRFLAGDALDLNQLSLDVDWVVEDGKLVVNRHHLVSDVGRLTASGRFDIGRILEGDFRGLLNDEEYSADGRFDLARLANMLPALFRVREGTQFTEGELKLSVSGSHVADGRLSQGRIETSNLKGLAGGRAVAWHEPVVVAWKATQSGDGELRAEASCTADFLDLKAEGTPVDAVFRATCDLNRLREAGAQFLDLNGLQLAGELSSELRLRQTDPATGPNLSGQGPDVPVSAARVAAEGYLRFHDFVFRSADGQLWQEPNMEVAINATGRANARGLEQIDQALLRVTTPSDQMQAKLMTAISPVSFSQAWPVDVEISGALETWHPRLQRLAVELPIEVRHIRGGIRGRLRSRVAADAVTLERADVELTQLDFQGGGYFVQEPRVVFAGDLAWSGRDASLRSKSSTLQTSALSVRVEDLQVATAEGDSSAAGHIVWAADLARLQRWSHDPATPLARQWSGALTGRADLSHAAGVTVANWEAVANQAMIAERALQPAAGPWQKVWSEREVTLSGQARHLTKDQVLELSRLDVSSDTIKLAETGGKIDLSDGPLRVDLSGNVVYDLAKVTALLQPYLGQQVHFAGSGSRPFSIRGPLVFSDEGTDSAASLRHLVAQAGVGWSQAQVYGLPVGEGQIQAELRDNVIQFAPLDVSLGQGRLRATPRIDLANSTPRLVVASGRAIENVRISPELCQSWLKFVAPLLADATRADGIFSLDLSRCQVPLADASQADVQGVVAIESAQIRPGPVSEPLVMVAQQIEGILKRQPLAALGSQQAVALNIPAQNLAFEVRDGRVHHKEFQLVIGDVVVKTTGSVGIADSSLNMVAEIPIQARWVERDRHLKGLAGQVLTIPLRGTLKQPKLDKRAVDDLAKKMVGSAAGGFLDDAVNRGLDEGLRKLFGQ